jgi:predicted DsbA family dithiol-disulfide isomerase
VKAYLDSDEDADTVKEDADQSRRMGINGVPFFVFNQKLSASGAQPPEALLEAMRQAAG